MRITKIDRDGRDLTRFTLTIKRDQLRQLHGLIELARRHTPRIAETETFLDSMKQMQKELGKALRENHYGDANHTGGNSTQ